MSLKKSPQKNLKRPLVIMLVAIVILGLAAGGAYYYHSHKDHSTNGPTKEQLEQERKADQQSKQNFIENTDSNGNPKTNGSSDNSTSPAQAAPTNSDVSMTVSQASNSVIVETKVGQVSSGTCTLTITNGSKHTSQTADILFQPEYSSCMGFSVPIGPLGNGQWNIVLTVSANGGEITKTTTFGVQ